MELNVETNTETNTEINMEINKETNKEINKESDNTGTNDAQIKTNEGIWHKLCQINESACGILKIKFLWKQWNRSSAKQ